MAIPSKRYLVFKRTSDSGINPEWKTMFLIVGSSRQPHFPYGHSQAMRGKQASSDEQHKKSLVEEIIGMFQVYDLTR